MGRDKKSQNEGNVDKGEDTQREEKKEQFQNEWFEGKSNDPAGCYHMRCGSVLKSIFELKAAWLKYKIPYITTRTSQRNLICHLLIPGSWPDFMFVSVIEIYVFLF